MDVLQADQTLLEKAQYFSEVPVLLEFSDFILQSSLAQFQLHDSVEAVVGKERVVALDDVFTV